MSRYLALALSLLLRLGAPLQAADSDSERLERLERTVQSLAQRNADLEKRSAA